MNCPSCSIEKRQGSAFCHNCGYELTVNDESVTRENVKRQRPLGITILSILHTLGGVAVIGIQILFAGTLNEASDQIGFSASFLFFSIAFLGLLGLGSGIGMWLGKTWGWWLGTFYYVYGIFRNANALITIPVLVEQFGEPSQGAEYYYVKHGTRIIIHCFLIFYFYKGNVVSYFNLGEYPKWKSILIFVGASIGVVILGTRLSL